MEPHKLLFVRTLSEPVAFLGKKLGLPFHMHPPLHVRDACDGLVLHPVQDWSASPVTQGEPSKLPTIISIAACVSKDMVAGDGIEPS